MSALNSSLVLASVPSNTLFWAVTKLVALTCKLPSILSQLLLFELLATAAPLVLVENDQVNWPALLPSALLSSYVGPDSVVLFNKYSTLTEVHL